MKASRFLGRCRGGSFPKYGTMIALVLSVAVMVRAEILPEHYICYCRPECSPRTRIYRHVDRRLYCFHPRKIPYGARKYVRLALRTALHYGLDPAVFCAQIECESGWRPSIVSRDGGYGLTQVTPRTAGIELDEGRLLDPGYNLAVGASIKLRALRLAERLSGCREPADVALLGTRIYNGGWRFLEKELDFLEELGRDKCKLSEQKRVCARDLCLWKVNVVYALRVSNGARKYRAWLGTLAGGNGGWLNPTGSG